MNEQNFDINKLRVASPCNIGWNTMTGDDRVRYCSSCKLNVYNFSEMTSGEVQNLIENTEGRICGRLFLRTDGTIITKDCPVGLRAFYKRTISFAGATLTAVLALFSFGFGQNQSACKKAGKIFITESHNLNLVEGTIIDPNCMAIPDAKITLINENTGQESHITSNKNGYYRILLSSPGRYTYKVEANGFMPHNKKLEITNNESLEYNVVLDVGGFVGVIVVTDEKSMIDIKSSGVTTKISREMMERIPH